MKSQLHYIHACSTLKLKNKIQLIKKQEDKPQVHYIQGDSRNQTTLFPATLDEYISKDNSVRFLDVFVDNLDLKALGFQRSVLSHTGRPPHHPSLLLKLYLYGSLYRTRSSRRLESECYRNIEVMWLLQQIAPDHKTISDFRKENLSALRQVTLKFILICKKLELFGKELIAIDGSKFEAVNSNCRNYTKRQLEQLIGKIDGYIDDYLAALDKGDKLEKNERQLSAEELQEQIEALKSNKQSYEELLSSLKRNGETQVSFTDAASRRMRDGHQGRDVCYNAQIAVDDKHHLIAADDVTNDCNDLKQLAPLAKQAQAILAVDEIDAVADTGYHDSNNIMECVDNGITPYVPRAKKSHNHKKGLYTKANFKYDEKEDCYNCPANKRLPFSFTYRKNDRLLRAYKNSKACNSCPLRSKCMNKKKGYRRITRWEHEHLLEKMEKRLNEHPEMMVKRRCLAEHPFGSLKRWMDDGYFLLCGLKKVRTEFSLMTFGYNLRRAINIVGVEKLIEAA